MSRNDGTSVDEFVYYIKNNATDTVEQLAHERNIIGPKKGPRTTWPAPKDDGATKKRKAVANGSSSSSTTTTTTINSSNGATPKFKLGDIVETPDGTPCKIINIEYYRRRQQ